MIEFKLRDEWNSTLSLSSSMYWNVYDDKKKIGWFGTFLMDGRQYTDIFIDSKYRGNGYFKRVYDAFICQWWGGNTLYAFVGKDNTASIRAHLKYGCKMLRNEKITYVYKVKDKTRRRK